MLAILNEDYQKVKSIESKQEINGLLNFLTTILNIKVANEEESFQLDKQMVLVFDLIKTKFGSLTIPEIKEAFKMYVAGEFYEIKIFRLIDCISVAEILTAYINFRNEKLRGYLDKKSKNIELPIMTESQKEKVVFDAVERFFKEYKETRKIEEPSEYIFDFLVKQKKIIVNNAPKVRDYYDLKLQQAREEAFRETKHQPINKKHDIQTIKTELEKIKNGTSSKIIIRAKRIVLAEFFDKKERENNETIF